MQIIARLNSSGGESSPYCTGSATCTASTPGSCDMRCDDFEGSTSCYAGHDSNCRGTWDYIYLGSGDSIDFTTTHNGTFSCTDKGDNAAQITVTGGEHYTFFRFNDDEDLTAAKGEFYFQLTSITLGDGSKQDIFEVTNGSNTEAFAVAVINSSGTHYFHLTGGGMTPDTGSTAMTLNGTWYHIGWDANQATDTVTIYLNGSQELQATDWDTTNALRRYVFGANAGYKTATALVSQYDNIAIDADGLPGGCN